MQGERDHGEGPRRMRIEMAGFISLETPIKIMGLPATGARRHWPGRSRGCYRASCSGRIRAGSSA
jgi:hypothetical protein